LGWVGFASQIPQLLLSPVAGVWVDRLNRHKVLIATQALSMLQSFALAVLIYTHHASIANIVILNMLQGFVNAFDIPARQSLTVDLVDRREDLSNAIALSSSMVHAARLVGPAVAGFMIYHFGEASCFLIDGFSYLAVLVSLLLMKLRPREVVSVHTQVFRSFKEGAHYAWNFPPIRAIMTCVAITSIFAMCQQVLLPIYSADVLGGGERVYGFLLCASGFGAFVGTMYLASRASVVGLGRVITRGTFMLGLGYTAFAFTHTFVPAILMLALAGCGLIVQIAACNTILQTIVDDSKRGRVMSLFSICFMGMMPIGSLLMGNLGEQLGTKWTFVISGVACMLNAAYFSTQLPKLREHVRPLYIKMGLLRASE